MLKEESNKLRLGKTERCSICGEWVKPDQELWATNSRSEFIVVHVDCALDRPTAKEIHDRMVLMRKRIDDSDDFGEGFTTALDSLSRFMTKTGKKYL